MSIKGFVTENGQALYDFSALANVPEVLKNIPVAQVGQMLIVQSVDEQGVITSLKPVNVELSGGGGTGEDGGYYTLNVTQLDAETLQIEFVPSKEGMEVIETQTITLPAGKNGDTPHIGVNGNWFIGDIDTGVKSSEVSVKTEDGERLPAEIEIDLSDDIPALVVAPLTAKVGQALVVDSVNESGKPAAWKAVDFPVGGGGGGGNVHFESQDFTIPEDSKGVEIQLPVPVKNLIMYNLVIVRPTYTPDVDKCRLFALHGGNNIEFASTSCTGSTNITGFRYGKHIGVTISTRLQDTYYEHTAPSIGATGKTPLGDGDKISLINMTDGIVFPAGTRVMFWGVYFQ